MKRIIVLLLMLVGSFAALSGLRHLGGSSGKASNSLGGPTDPLQSSVAVLEGELRKELQLRARGFATEDDVDYARVNLAKARHDVALVANNRADMLDQLRLVLAIREREWERVGSAIDRGILAPADAENVQRRLAVARYRLASFEQREEEARKQIGLVAELCARQAERNLKAFAHRAVGLRVVNDARYRASCARYVLAKEAGKSDEIRHEIERAVTLWESESERAIRLYQSGAGSYFESYSARRFLLDVQLRQATFGRNRDVADKLLRLRISLVEEALPLLDPTDAFLRRQRPGIEWQLAFDRLSLERLREDGVFPVDTAAAELDG